MTRAPSSQRCPVPRPAGSVHWPDLRPIWTRCGGLSDHQREKKKKGGGAAGYYGVADVSATGVLDHARDVQGGARVLDVEPDTGANSRFIRGDHVSISRVISCASWRIFHITNLHQRHTDCPSTRCRRRRSMACPDISLASPAWRTRLLPPSGTCHPPTPARSTRRHPPPRHNTPHAPLRPRPRMTTF